MTKNRLRNDTCLLSIKEPKIVKYALEDVEWYKYMKEKIEEKEKNKNDFSDNQEFLLDPRYKAFVGGKSNKLYWSRENNELSIISILMLLSGFVGIFLFRYARC